GIFAFAPSAEFWSFIGQSLQVNAGENVQNVTLRLSKILQLLQPANNSTVSTTTPTLSWQAFPGAVRYHVQLNETATDQLIISGDTTSTMMVTPVLTSGRTYRWLVDAYDADGIRIAYYSEWRFSVSTA